LYIYNAWDLSVLGLYKLGLLRQSEISDFTDENVVILWSTHVQQAYRI